MAKRGVIVFDLRVGETLELAHALHDAQGEGVDTPKIQLTLMEKTGKRARIAVQAADTVKVTRPSRQAA